jgi:hypothetical protein
MIMSVVRHLYSGIAPLLALVLLLLLLPGRDSYPDRKRVVGLILWVVFCLSIPVDDWPSFLWIALLEPNPSFILTVLLGIALWEKVNKTTLLRPCDWTAVWSFGSIAALILYPMGLGLTTIDPYSWGWTPIVPVITAVIATILLLRDNRCGVLLLLPLLGFFLHIQESRNFWDALIDPFFGGVSIVALTISLMRKRVARHKTTLACNRPNFP